MRHFDVLVVGAGHAGSQVAMTLRQLQFSGSIGILGEELDVPYERPPLSKNYLLGEQSLERLLIRPTAFWHEQNISVCTGRQVINVLPHEHVVLTNTREHYSYGHLVWAAGGSPRRLTCPGGDLNGVHYIRTRANVDALLAELHSAKDVVVIGGGYIGLEAAAAMRKMGKAVVILESQDRVLARVSCEIMSRFVEAEHRAHGAEIRLSTHVDCLTGEGGRVSAVHLKDGSRIAADVVIVGIGIMPSVQPLAEAGAACPNGVLVDAQCRTNLPDVFAIGDCALHANHFADGATVRIESVQNAVDQANVLAKVLLGQDARYESLPWFWSTQYDLKLQSAGLSLGYQEIAVRGDPAQRSFSIEYKKDGRVIAVDCVNAPRDYVAARKALSERVSVATLAPQ